MRYKTTCFPLFTENMKIFEGKLSKTLKITGKYYFAITIFYKKKQQ